MAGHSHWAGIKHKKEEQTKELEYSLNFQEKLLLLPN